MLTIYTGSVDLYTTSKRMEREYIDEISVCDVRRECLFDYSDLKKYILTLPRARGSNAGTLNHLLVGLHYRGNM